MRVSSYAIVFLISLFVLACGDGDFRVNPTAGTLSTASGTGGPDGTAKQYFTTNLFPLMTANTGSKGCLGSGCHEIDTNRPRYFQLDASDANSSYNWAGARRASVLIGNYADGTAQTLKAKKDTNHNNFNNWTPTEKALIDTWTDLP